MALYDRAIAIRERLVEAEGRRELANVLAMACVNKASTLSALGDNRAAVALYDRAIAIRERLVEAEGRRELANKLAMAYLNKANALGELGTIAPPWPCATGPSPSTSGWWRRRAGASWRTNW